MVQEVDSTLAKARKISNKIISDWPNQRDVYLVEEKEIIALISGGAGIILLNYDNGDGTFSHEVEFEGNDFKAITQSKIQD